VTEERLLDNIPASSSILDLGAGDLRLAESILKVKENVTIYGVDTRIPQSLPKGVHFYQADIIDIVRGNTAISFPILFDVIILRNIIQFFDKNFVINELFPWIKDNASVGARVILETFTKRPTPGFPDGIIVSTYSLNDFRQLGENLFIDVGEEEVEDLNGEIRTFAFLDAIYKLD